MPQNCSICNFELQNLFAQKRLKSLDSPSQNLLSNLAVHVQVTYRQRQGSKAVGCRVCLEKQISSNSRIQDDIDAIKIECVWSLYGLMGMRNYVVAYSNFR